MSDISGRIDSIRWGQDFVYLGMENLMALQLFQTAGVIKEDGRYINHNAVSRSLIGNIADGILKLELSSIFSVEKTFLNSIEGDTVIVSEKTAIMLFLASKEMNSIEPSKVFGSSLKVIFNKLVYVVQSNRMDNGSHHEIHCYKGSKLLKKFPLVF